MQKPIPWFGGKYYLSKRIVNLMPQHHTYVEVFGGSAAVLFAKTPSPVEVYNDIDSGLVNLFRVIRDNEKYKELQKILFLTPYSREEYRTALRIYRNKDEYNILDDVTKAAIFYTVAYQSFSGAFGRSWGFSVTHTSRGMSGSVSAYLSAISKLPEFHARIASVQIENLDFRKIFEIYDTPDTLFYLDPPYMPDTRKDGEYDHEMSVKDHTEMIQIIKRLRGKVILSGYETDLYNRELDGWYKETHATYSQAIAKTKQTKYLGENAYKNNEGTRRIEVIWASFTPEKPTPSTLF